jgi:tRNA-binding EMAP/Myf-like protein
MGAPTTAIELLEDLISDLESKLNLPPGADPIQPNNAPRKNDKPKKKQTKPSAVASPPPDLPDICKLEFKVGLITKVWVHPEADKLYCEEIDVGEEGGPRQIASGLRPYYSEEEMLGKRVLVVANLKVSFLEVFEVDMSLCAFGLLIMNSYRIDLAVYIICRRKIL